MEGFKQNTNPVLRAQAAIALFGREGQKLIPFLIKGKAGLAEMAAAAKQLNIPLEDLMAGVEAGKAMKELSHSVESAKNAVAAAILPAFVPMVKAISEWVRANRSLLRQVALPAFLGLITTAVISLGVALLGVLGPFSLLAGAIIAAGVAIYQNWGSIISWLDKEVPGLTTTIATAAADLGAWASKSMAAITAGFRQGGLSGGLVAIWNVFKDAGQAAISFVVDLFTNTDWAGVGNTAAAMLGQAFMALMRAEIVLGDFIIEQVQAAWAWIKAVDWGSVGREAGTLIGTALLLALQAAFDVALWVATAAQQIGAGIANADWIAIVTKIGQVFADFQLTIVRIGKDLIVGLIAGMIDAIPGLRKVTDGIASFFTSIPGLASKAAGAVSDTFNNSGAFLGGPSLNPYGNLLLGAGGGPQTAKVESNTKIQVLLPPGATATATTDQTGGRAPEVNVGVNGAGMAMP
jgi:hypothetical protein